MRMNSLTDEEQHDIACAVFRAQHPERMCWSLGVTFLQAAKLRVQHLPGKSERQMRNVRITTDWIIDAILGQADRMMNEGLTAAQVAYQLGFTEAQLADWRHVEESLIDETELTSEGQTWEQVFNEQMERADQQIIREETGILTRFLNFFRRRRIAAW